LALWFGSSSVRVTIPSESCSQRMVLVNSDINNASFEVRWVRRDYTRSTMVAVPMPPPMHRVTRP
jgi:hypothetical protein